jgi:branched-chain amino acid transport system substrate-binding protein
MAGCGSRVGHDQIVAGAGDATVTLSPGSLAQLRQVSRDARPNTQAVAQSDPLSNGAVGPATGTQAHPAPLITNGSTREMQETSPSSKLSPQSADAATSAANGPSCTGASQAPVAIGQVGTFSGVVGPITASARPILAAWAKDLNASGGLACHPVMVYSADDGGDPSRAAAAVKELVAQHHVVALVGNIATLSMGGFKPAVEAAQIPAIDGAPVDGDFQSPWFFPAGAGTNDIATGVIANAAGIGHKKLGLLYCVEASACTQIYQFVKDRGARAAGAQLVYSAPVSIAQPDFTAQCLNARSAGVDVLGLAMDGASMTRLGRSCAAMGYRSLLASSAAVITTDPASDENLRCFGLTSATSVVPWLLDDQPGLRAYHRVLKSYASNVTPDGASIITWAAAQLFEAAINNVATPARVAPITPSLVLAGLGKVHDDTLGGVTGPLTFTPGEAHAISNGCIFYMTLTTRGWTAPRGSTPACFGR